MVCQPYVRDVLKVSLLNICVHPPSDSAGTVVTVSWAPTFAEQLDEPPEGLTFVPGQCPIANTIGTSRNDLGGLYPLIINVLARIYKPPSDIYQEFRQKDQETELQTRARQDGWDSRNEHN